VDEAAERFAEGLVSLGQLHDAYHDAAAVAEEKFYAVHDAAEADATALDLPDS